MDHCGPGGIFVFNLGGAGGNDGPGGVALLDHDSFEVIGPWEADRGEQFFGYDGWWHLHYDTVITSEWATPSMVEHGLDPQDLLGRRFGHHLNFWSMSDRKLTQRVDLGDAHQMVFEVRPAHDPEKAWGLVGVVINVEDLSGSVWAWHRDGDRWAVTKVITIPAEPTDPELLPAALKPFGAVPPLVSDIDLSVDDRWLYVSCWGTGELKQYDVADLFHPRETGSVRLGGIIGRQSHPAAPDQPLGGGPQMVEVSRDGRRVYVTNSIYGTWDPIFYPNGVGAWMAKLDTNPDTGGGLTADPGSSPTATTSAGCGSTRSASKAGMPPATPTATPADHATPGPPRRRGHPAQPAGPRRQRALAHGGRRPRPAGGRACPADQARARARAAAARRQAVAGQRDDGDGGTRKGPTMLNGDKVVLRPVRERDLAAFIDAHTEISNRGEFFPLGVQSESALRRNYAETGFWERDAGTLLIWNRDDVMVGHIEFFRPVNYWDAYELSYQLYGQEHAGQGYTTEAVRLLVDYLFGAKKVNRISLVIVPENAPSRRIAEKCGFQLEGTARGAFFHGGRSVDVLIYSLLRDDPRPCHKSD